MVALSNVTHFQTKAGKAIEDFLNGKAKRSDDTLVSYRGDINKFLEVVFNKSINTITAEELELLDYDSFSSFLDSLHGKLANGTINRQGSCIKSLYRHLNKTKTIKTDLAFFGFIDPLPSNPNSYELMPIEVMEQYLEAVRYEKHKPIEKKWAIKLAIEMALRDAEVRDLKWSQFKPDGEFVIVTGYGKGTKEYKEKIDREVYEELVSELKVDGQKTVFTLNKKNITDMMKRLKKHLGHEDRNYVFHSFKKTSVNFTYEVTGNFRDAQTKAKHSKPETTQLYLQEREIKMTGYFSLQKNLNHNLYKEVDYNTLMKALKTMPKELLFSLNMKLNDNSKE